MVRTIYQQLSPAEVHGQLDRVVEQLREPFAQVAELLADAAPDILAFTAFPVAHWQKLWSNNPQERLNREIRRRTDVVGVFPNRAATRRLVGAVLAEQHDEWAEARRYPTIDKDVNAEVLPSANILEAAALTTSTRMTLIPPLDGTCLCGQEPGPGQSRLPVYEPSAYVPGFSPAFDGVALV